MAAVIGLPFDPSHQEVQTALNLGAVYETVNVVSINGLFFLTPCTMACWENDKEEQKVRGTYEVR